MEFIQYFVAAILLAHGISAERSRSRSFEGSRNRANSRHNIPISDVVNIDTNSEGIIELAPNSSQALIVQKLTSGVKFVHLSAHSQVRPISISLKPQLTDGFFVKGNDVGLIDKLDRDRTSCGIFFLFNENNVSVNVLAIVRSGREEDPVPGDCNTDLDYGVSPSLKVRRSNDRQSFFVSFQPASPNVTHRSTWPKCDWAKRHLRYDFRAAYLNQADYSEETYFRTLLALGSNRQLLHTTHRATPMDAFPKNEAGFAVYPDVGLVVTVIVYNSVSNFTYTPIVVYSCNFTSEDCPQGISFAEGITSTLWIFAGFFLCFLGHRYFKTTLLIIGYASGIVICYVVLQSLFQPWDMVGLSISSGLYGLVGASIWLAQWTFIGSPTISALLFSFVFGFLLSSTVFYFHALFFPVAFPEVIHSNTAFWLVFLVILLIPPIVGTIYPKTTSIVTSTTVGTFMIIFAISRIGLSSIAYILLNVIHRMTLEGFDKLNIAPPFQVKEVLLVALGITIWISGLLFQVSREQGRPSFPRLDDDRQGSEEIVIVNRRMRPPPYTVESVTTTGSSPSRIIRISSRSWRGSVSPPPSYSDQDEERRPLLPKPNTTA